MAARRHKPFGVKQRKGILAKRVFLAMGKNGWSIADLSWEAGISHHTLRRVLSSAGVQLNAGGTLLGLAVALEVSLDWLVGQRHADGRVAKGKGKRVATRG